MTEKNLSLFKVFMSEDVIAPLNEVVMSGFITQGPQVEKFEEKLSEYFGNEHLLTLKFCYFWVNFSFTIIIK